MASKLTLTDREWKAFKIGDLFEVKIRGKRLILSDREVGKFPFVTAGENNNGISSFIHNPTQKLYENSITLDMFGNSFYQNFPFKCDDNITVLKNKNTNQYSAFFVVTLLNRLTKKYSYGNQVRPNRLKNDKIMLPINETGEPDWQFMEDYIKQIEKDKIETLLSYLNQYNALAEPSRAEPSRAEPSRAEPSRAEPSRAEPSRAEPSRAEPSRAEPSRAEIVWAKFKLSQIFFIKSGVRLTKSEMTRGDMPFIGATEFNNGITEFVSNTNASLDKNILGVNYNGSVVENFYHPYYCIFSDDVKRLELKNKDYANKWVYLFLKTTILQQKEKYQYGYKFNAQRMSKQTIMLPTDDNGEPNWAYMESVMKEIEMKKILQILQHYEY